MASSQGRSLQDILGAPSSSRQDDRATPGDVSESSDEDYEPTTDDESPDINDPEYLEAILRGADGEDADEPEDEDGGEDEGIATLYPLLSSKS